MSKSNTERKKALRTLITFLDNNPDLDPSRVDLYDEEITSAFSWKGIRRLRGLALHELRAYQRLARLTEDGDRERVLSLLRHGIRSALDISRMPRPRFLQAFSEVFDGDRVALERIYRNALATRSRLMVSYLRARQGHEPHSARLGSKAMGV